MLITFFAEHFPNGPDPFLGYTNNLGKLFKFYSGYFFPCSSEIFLKIHLKIRTKVPQPSENELTSSTNTLGTNSPLQWYLYRHHYTTTNSRRLTDHQQQLTRSRQECKNIIS